MTEEGFSKLINADIGIKTNLPWLYLNPGLNSCSLFVGSVSTPYRASSLALSGPCWRSERILDVLSSGKSSGFRPRRLLRADCPPCVKTLASSREASDASDIGVEVSLAVWGGFGAGVSEAGDSSTFTRKKQHFANNARKGTG